MPHHSPTHTDPRSPLVIDTIDLPRRPGALRVLERQVPALTDLGLELIGVPGDAELDLRLRLESVSEGVLVSGTVSAPLTGECGRCLRSISDTIEATFQELFAYADTATDETTDDDEVGRLDGDLIDLESTVRDAVVLALPVNPLCRVDCPGLCPECGVRLDELPAEHRHDQVDPRWAALVHMNTAQPQTTEE